MMRQTIFLMSLILTTTPVGAADPDISKTGIKVTRGAGITTPSLAAYKSIQNNGLRQYDYYYQLRVAAGIQPKQRNCEDSTSGLIEALFGKTHFRTVAAKIDPRIRKTQDVERSIAKENLPLLFAGFNADSGGAKRGCFFQQIQSARLPWLRYDSIVPQKGSDEFAITISGEQSMKTEYQTVKLISGLFTKFNAAWSWTSIPDAKVQAITALAEQIEKAINSQGVGNIKNQGEWVIRATPDSIERIEISAPNLVGDVGSIKLIVHATASLFFDQIPSTSLNIDPDAVLNNTALMTRQCAKDIFKKSECESGPSTVLEGLMTSVAKTGSAFLFDLATPEGLAEVRNTCQKLRTYSTTTLQLSTLDALLVRWAALQQYGVIDTLGRMPMVNEIAKAAKVQPAVLISGPQACWTEDDTRKLTNILVKLNLRTTPVASNALQNFTATLKANKIDLKI